MTIEDLDKKIDKIDAKQDEILKAVNSTNVTQENHRLRIETLESEIKNIKSDKKDFRKTWIAPIAISLIIGSIWFVIGMLNFVQIKQHQGTSITQNVKP